MTVVGWRPVLVFGLALWVLATGALALTEDTILLPSVVLIGSFLVPVAAIFWFLDRDVGKSELSPERLVAAFFVAGVMGLTASAVLETWLLPHRALPNLWVGLIEEFFKGAGVFLLSRGFTRWSIRDGVVLGTTVGLGFGAFEASGYTLTWGMSANGFSLRDMISEEVLRMVIAPFCHGVWTALFAAALFASRGRLGWRVLAVYLGTAALHAVWDAGSTLAIVATVLLSGTPEQRDDVAHWQMPMPSSLDAQYLYGAVQWTVMVLAAVAGVVWLRRWWLRDA